MSFLRNRTVIGVFCILLSVLICFGLTPLFNRAVSQKVEIVRVTQPIRAGEQITDDMVQLVQVGGYNLPDNVLHEKGNAVGKYATADLAVGDYIINTKLSDVPAADNAYLYDLDGSQQAISVTIRSFANGLSGKLQSGDIVSVVAPDYKQQGQTVIPPELQYVDEMSDDTLMDLVTEAFPVVAFAKQLEDKSRKIMEIMECVIQPDGSRQYNTLYHFAIEDNRLEDGKYYIDGHHEPVHPISANLQKHFIDNGMPQQELDRLLAGFHQK